MIGLTLYTLVTMCGGNPLGDKYGFRFWKNPGPFGGTSGLATVRGIFDSVVWACFGVVGPDYLAVSIHAGPKRVQSSSVLRATSARYPRFAC